MSITNSIRKLLTKNLVDVGQALVSLNIPGEVITDDLSTAWRNVGQGHILRVQTSGDTYVAFNVSDHGADSAEITPITCVADVTDSLDGTYFILNEPAGSVAFWIDTDNSGTAEPAHGASRSVEITTIVTNDADTVVAGKVATAINADSEFNAPAPGAAIVTVTNAVTGVVGDANAGTSGFTIGTITQGTGQLVSSISSPAVKLVGAGIHYIVCQCDWVRTSLTATRVELHKP